MSENIDYQKLASEIARNMLDLNPSRLWAVQDIANYLHKAEQTVKNRIVCDPTFPRAFNPARGQRLWLAGEVQAWATTHQGRPRKTG